MYYFFFILYTFSLWIIYPILLVIILIRCIVDKSKFKTYLYKLSIKTPFVKQPNIWIHGVSAGEISSISRLVYLLKKRYNIFITTTTSSGIEMAKKLFPNQCLSYYPFDYTIFCKRLIKKVKPKAIIFIESEIWPNILKTAKSMNVPTFLISGRMPEKEYKRYRILSSFFKEVFNLFTLITMQSEEDFKRIKSFGIDKSKLKVIRSLKFDFRPKENILVNYKNNGSLIIIASSTHRQEEALIIKAYKELLILFPFLKLFIAPRHPNRARTVMRIAKRYKLVTRLRTNVNLDDNSYNVLIINTIGELISFYKMSDVVILGGTFNKKIGGHNPIEPCYFNKAVIVGPYTYNFDFIVKKLITNKGIIQIKVNKSFSDKKAYYTNELYYHIKKLLKDKAFRTKLSNNGYNTILYYSNSSEKNVELIMPYL